MSGTQLTYGLILVGVVVVLAALLVDAVGIGTEGFGTVQIIGVVVGAILAAVGLYRAFVRRTPLA